MKLNQIAFALISKDGEIAEGVNGPILCESMAAARRELEFWLSIDANFKKYKIMPTQISLAV